MSGKTGLLFFVLAIGEAAGQLPFDAAQEHLFSDAIERAGQAGDLDCRIETEQPFLDFSFRYEIGYIATCPLGQFEGKRTFLGTQLTIRPRHGIAVTKMGQGFQLPAVPPEMRAKFDARRLHSDIDFSGVFAAGEGEYDIELSILDDQGRLRRKRWQTKAARHGRDGQARIAMEPNIVSAISTPTWQGVTEDGSGLRLTVLLDAAPMHSMSTRLRAWDCGFLLGSLSSLLRAMPLARVRVIAFNLDQQREVFREEDFDRAGFYRLMAALTRLELGAISYQKLARRQGWADLLSSLVRGEVNGSSHSDAVVFLGPNNRILERMPEYYLGNAAATESVPPLFYFEYFPRRGRDFPDTIHHLVDDRKGSVFKVYSPSDLAAGIVRMQRSLADDSRQAGLRH